MKAEERIELAGRLGDESVELARWVCLATRIDPALIRRARLGLMRGASAGVESDLWFGPLVQTAGARYILFYPEVSAALRARLAARRGDLARARTLTRRTHRTLPELVRLEEKITWLALVGGPRLEQKLDALLRPLVKAVLTGQREGLGRWALNVLPHMPESARESKSARLLRAVAESQLYGGWSNLLTTAGEGPTDEEAALLLRGLEHTAAGLRLVGDRLEVSEPPADYARLIKVPATNPRVLELSWSEGEAHGQSRLTWQKGCRAHTEGVHLPVTVNTLAGDSHRLVGGEEVADSLRQLAAPFFVFILDRKGQPVGLGVLVGDKFVIASSRFISGSVGTEIALAVERISLRFPYQRHDGDVFARIWFARNLRREFRPETSITAADRPLLLELEESFSAMRPAKLKSAFDFVGRVLTAPGLPPYDDARRWATFEVGGMTDAGEFALTPATQIKPEELGRWSGAPLIDAGTGDVAGVVLAREDASGPSLALYSLNQITRNFPEIFAAGSTVLVSFSHKDRKHVEEFRSRMEAGGLRDRLVLWSDNPLGWRGHIEGALESAAAVVIFVSPSYLASDLMSEEGLSPLLERAQERGTLILPVILHASMFMRTSLAQYQAVNRPDRPLSGMSSVDRDTLFGYLSGLLSKRLGVTAEATEESRPKATHDFFISYAKADSTWAEWIVWELEEAGYSVVIQAWDFRPGDNFVRQMLQAMSAAERTIVVLSPEFLASELARSEWMSEIAEYSHGEATRLLLVRVREAEPTGLLAATPYLDLIGLEERTAKDLLLDTVRRIHPEPLNARRTSTGASGPATFPGLAPLPPTVPDEVPTDIFVSYAMLDNEPFGAPKGWVDLLVERLRVRLTQLLGREPNIYRDSWIHGGSDFVEELRETISKSRLFLCVVSPGYVNSDWCRNELHEMVEGAARTGGLRLGNRSRVLKVVKTYVPPEEQPEELRDILGYEFYERDEHGRAREFRPDVTPLRNELYWMKLEDLAHDIKQSLDLRPGSDRPRAVS
jgi:TIR domain